jgi:hypothetical protein
VNRLRRFLRLSAAQRDTFLWSLALMPLAAAVLRTRGLAAARVFAGSFPIGPACALAPADAARMVNAAGSLLRASCLARSLLLWRLLRERGATIRLGVARPAPAIVAAHAWVELDGAPLNDLPDVIERYAVLEAVAHRPGA